jgi:hypothetical protein
MDIQNQFLPNGVRRANSTPRKSKVTVRKEYLKKSNHKVAVRRTKGIFVASE